MSLPLPVSELPAPDPRALSILAKSIYRELRASGYCEKDVLALAGELLDVVADEVEERTTRD